MTRLKLDENLGAAAAAALEKAGFDVSTVPHQRLEGASDDDLFARCRSEGRCLVTLDLDFANPLRFPVQATPGICVLRYAPPTGHAAILSAIATLASALRSNAIAGQLWIVSPDRVRVYTGRDD